MTFEEIQQIIEGMLQVQSELQQTQLKIQQQQAELQQQQIETDRLMKESGERVDRRIEQLVGYSIAQAGDVIDIQMALRGIYARLSKLEDERQEDNPD